MKEKYSRSAQENNAQQYFQWKVAKVMSGITGFHRLVFVSKLLTCLCNISTNSWIMLLSSKYKDDVQPNINIDRVGFAFYTLRLKCSTLCPKIFYKKLFHCHVMVAGHLAFHSWLGMGLGGPCAKL